MKKAVIATGGKQYLVSVGDTVEVELLKADSKTVSFVPLLVIDDDNIMVGTPEVSKVSVKTEIVEPDLQAEKVTAIRYKAKKRVHKLRGHRQHHTKIKITAIA